jgi:hypothetical protein
MQHTKTLLRMLAVGAVVGLATLALPHLVHAGVRVSIGLGVPVSPTPVVVAPAPVVVYPAPVVVPSPPVVVAPPPVVYGSGPFWVQGPYGHRHRHWRHHHHAYRW